MVSWQKALEALSKANPDLRVEVENAGDVSLIDYLASEGGGEGRRNRSTRRTLTDARGTDWTDYLIDSLRLMQLPLPEAELKFHPERKWRFDLHWQHLGAKLACEIEGGTWMRTGNGYSRGHAHPERFESDCEKYSEAALLGWCVIRVTPKMIQEGKAVDLIQRALRAHNLV